jgi:hypothetical protein
MKKTTLALCVLWMLGMNSIAFKTILRAEDNPRLISAVLEGPSLKDRIQKTSMTFTRDSVACTFDGREVRKGTPRFQKIAIFNRPEYKLTSPYSNENIVALAYNDGFFWGAKPWTHNNNKNSLYRSLDANNWEPVATLKTGTITSLYVTGAGLLLIGTTWPGGVCIYDPNTGGFMRVLTMTSNIAFPKHWSWAEMNGVIYVGEYGNKNDPNNNARRIYQSFDGGWNWEVLYDPPPMKGYHVHKVLADPYRSYIYWSHGDEAGSQLFRSTDLGQTWDLISNVEQPTAGIARPEGAYFGADSGGAGIYRFLDGSENGEYVCTDLVKGYIWDMQDFNGVIYATSLNHLYWGPPSVIISKDGDHWGNLFQWQTGMSGLERFASKVDDIIYAVMEEEVSNVTTMSFAAPIIRTSWGMVVEPPIENLLANPCYSSFEGCTQSSWYAYYDTAIEVTSDRAHSGNNSLKVSNTSNYSTMEIASPVVYGDFPAGTMVSATVQISGWNKNTGWIYMGIWDTTNRLMSSREYKRVGTGWSELTVYWRVPQNSRSLRMDIVTWSGTSETVFYIDSVTLAINQVPVSFQIGGQERAAEILSHSICFPNCWTDVFCWQPPYSPSAVDQTKVIKSWSVEDGNSWLQLVIDQASNFKLEEVKQESTKSLVSVPVPKFLPYSLIRFVIVQDSNQIRLHILGPEGWVSNSGRRTDIRPTCVFFGSTPGGANQAGGLYSNARVYNDGLTDSQIIHVIDEIAEQGWVVGDLDKDGDVTFSDLSELVRRWLNTDANNPNKGGAHADLNMDNRVDMEDLAVLAENWYWEK